MRVHDFIDQSRFRRGALVNIETGFVKAALTPGKAPDFPAIRRAVNEGGFKLLTIHARLEGKLELAGTGWTLRVDGHAFTYALGSLPGKNPKAGQGAMVDVKINARDLVAIRAGQPIPVIVKQFKNAPR